MCLAAALPILITTVMGAVGSAIQAKGQNAQSQAVYQQQLNQQKLANEAIANQSSAEQQRIRQNQLQQGNAAVANSQQQVLQAQRAQATAVASGGTAGITGTPLSMLFNDYQTSVGSIGTNLATEMDQLNQQTFFNRENSLLQTQSAYNQSTPAAPFMASMGQAALMGGLSGAMSSIGSGLGSKSSLSTKATTSVAPVGRVNPLPPVTNINPGFRL